MVGLYNLLYIELIIEEPLNLITYTVTNLFNNRQVRIDWTADTASGVVGHRIYKSAVPYAIGTLVATVSLPAVTYVDTISTIVFNEWYYWVVSWNGTTEGPREQIGKTYIDENAMSVDPFTDQSPYVYPDNSDMQEWIDEIKRRNLWLCQQNSEPMKLLKIRYEGTPCPLIDSESMQCSKPKGSPIGTNACWGTGFLESYTDQLNIKVRIVNANRPVKLQETGLTISQPTRMWTVFDPKIATNDILVTQDNRRFLVTEPFYSTVRGVRLHQEFTVELKPPRDTIYSIPITV